MSEIKDDKLSNLDKQIANLMEERQKRIDELVDPVFIRTKKLYEEIASRFDELQELGDNTWQWGDYDQQVGINFTGRYFEYDGDGIKPV